MPYGLSNSPSVFQAVYERGVPGVSPSTCDFFFFFFFFYINDILIYSRNLAEHRHHILQVLLQLRKHQLYLKLEKCEFHRTTVPFLGYVINPEGIQMDQGKVQVINSWPQPQSVKELQRFLGFSNFYQRFIHNFSLLTAPITSLLRHQHKSLSWTLEAITAFEKLKRAFCTTPILKHMEPQLSFVVEVDASTMGLGAVLSQYHREPPLLHPCKFYSKKLTPVEQNYDIGNRELLAIKLALEEWRHWLEGAQHPFTIITDHKNLEYIQNAKRLNSRQARWALYFTITYHPGNKNVKADSLSRLHQPDSPTTPEPILSPAIIVSPIQWDLDEQIRIATLTEPALLGGPEERTSLRLTFLGSLHASPGSGH